jgi:hypothetical protein
MGLLEDAIREHLDLKRQHGADAAEVSQQEREALGPVNRAAEPAVIEDDRIPQDAPEPLDGPVEDLPEDPVFEHHEDDFVEEDDGPVATEPPPPPAADPGSAPFDFEDEPFAPERPAADEPEDAAGDEVDLEETPEFLQETPEHDRLWFEQKPPRDFDFDR